MMSWARYRLLGATFMIVVVVGHFVSESWSVNVLVDRDRVSRRPSILPKRSSSEITARLYRPPALTPQVENHSRRHVVTALVDTAVANTATRFHYAHFPAMIPRYPTDSNLSGSKEQTLALVCCLFFMFNMRFCRRKLLLLLGFSRFNIVPLETWYLSPPIWVDRGHLSLHIFHGLPTWNRSARPCLPPTSQRNRFACSATARLRSRPMTPSITPCAILAYQPESVTLRCNAEQDGYAVLLDAWAQGWTATVDGVDAPIALADGLVRAVRVSPGEHTIQYRYQTPGFLLGALIFGVSWAVLLLAAGVLRFPQVETLSLSDSIGEAHSSCSSSSSPSSSASSLSLPRRFSLSTKVLASTALVSDPVGGGKSKYR